MLKITKVFNNNAVLAENEIQTELVVLGKGVAFAKKLGDYVDADLIEKTFSLNKSPFTPHLIALLEQIPPIYFQLTNQIVNEANKQLGTPLSNSIYVSLTDHLFHAIERAKNHQQIPNALTYEIQRLYRAEFALGLFAIAKIREYLKVELDEHEAAFIALHIFNARTDGSTMHDTYQATQIIKDILRLVRLQFNYHFDEDSYDFQRFLTHLQHFAQRFFISGQHTSSDDDFLYQQTKLAYPKAYQCVEKINRYLQQHYQKSLNQDEQLYLTIHIQRVVKSK
ncbi:PRD domain-containing protein [Actinobacillus equuli subsp. haemolyticus]|uniref:BglG family transcription antiterminator LicT n=1 Tax=Actinobacillus equuli TaxID=718 RepID=UPI002442EF16|nr:PRD domain-containing protein [Actinobacillus equuli]WGE62711.1 PRD domain-containing protein [Actinobacillus equuli subsp. haemolyticus]